MTEKLGRCYFGDYLYVFGTYIQNNFRNTKSCYLGYTTVTSTLRLFADVLNSFKCKYCTISLIILFYQVCTMYFHESGLKTINHKGNDKHCLLIEWGACYKKVPLLYHHLQKFKTSFQTR